MRTLLKKYDPVRSAPLLPQRVLMTTDAVGGVWQYSLELARGFDARGIEVVLVVLGPVPSAAQLVEAAAVPGMRLVPTQLPLDWTATVPESLHAAAGDIADIAALCEVDLVHLHTPALIPQARWPAPVVAVAHSCVRTWWHTVRGGALPRDFIWRAECMAAGLKEADAVIAPSHSFARLLKDVYDLARPITVVRNGRRALRQNTADRRRAVLTAGRLWDEGKNVAVLDAAAPRIPAPIYAAGPLRGPNGEAISFSHVHPLGCLAPAQLAAEYAATKVFAAPSRYEPFGLAVLEAAQAGMALVLSDTPTFRELWDGAARFVAAADPDEWAAAIRELLDYAEDCAFLAEAAQHRARDYQADTMVEGTIAVHRSALASPMLV
jgi:glycosyltransferase involved in cell wall biosynthesis